jgi:salicylate hydroxylase
VGVAASHNPHHDGKMKNVSFDIIGGGVAGLASALAAANSGNMAVVKEKANTFEAIGAGLQLGPNAVRALQKLGAWDAIEKSTTRPEAIIIRDGHSGHTLSCIELGKKFEMKFGVPYHAAHRADVMAGLLSVARTKPNIEIQTGCDVSQLQEGKNTIVADGVWSKIRQNLFPHSQAIITTDIYHRALVPLPNTHENHVGLWLYAGGHLVHYAVGKPAKLNIVAITQGQNPATHFAAACSELAGLIAHVSNWSVWPSAHVPKLKQWNQGNTILLGDAAHGTLPYLAQGAAMALEDAASLNDILSGNAQTVAQAFAHLSATRAPRTQSLHTAALQAGKIYHLSGPMAKLRNVALKNAPQALMAHRMNWIYRY